MAVCRHTLFLDEVGHADIKSSHDVNQRYLSLTGIIFDRSHYESIAIPKLDALKVRFFGTKDVVLHRSEIVSGSHPFDKLKTDPALGAHFGESILTILEELDYTVLTTTIDKLEHTKRYKVWQAHPYHYCLECILERYVKCLEKRGAVGDVLAEARGKKEDKKLKASYAYFYKHGTRFVSADRLQKALTTKELKLKCKTANVNGLQMADLIAHPSFRHAWSQQECQPMKARFGKRLVQILMDTKYDRSPRGLILSYGLKWLP